MIIIVNGFRLGLVNIFIWRPVIFILCTRDGLRLIIALEWWLLKTVYLFVLAAPGKIPGAVT